MCTGMMALVAGVMADATWVGSRHRVSGSTSTSTGVAPVCTMALAVLMMEKAGVMTSSPGPRPRAAQTRCRAAVPLAQATPWATPQSRAMPSSKRSRNWPAELIQPVSRHWLTYSDSRPASSGSQTGMNSRTLMTYRG